MRLDRCSTCDAPILWALSRRGAKMPMDAQPDDNEEKAFVLVKAEGVDPVAFGWSNALRALFDDGHDRHDDVRLAFYHSHFGSCPDADRHRRS